MKKAGSDSKVKKTLLRNYETKLSKECNAVIEIDGASSYTTRASSSQKENKLDRPTLCTSEVIANYLVIPHSSAVAVGPLNTNDTNIDKAKISAKVTKKLNFPFNNRIYKNLVEINTDVANLKCKKDKKTKTTTTLKKDLEPCIEDFCSDEKKEDEVPDVPLMILKFKPVKKIEDGSLHRLVASFEKL